MIGLSSLHDMVTSTSHKHLTLENIKKRGLDLVDHFKEAGKYASKLKTLKEIIMILYTILDTKLRNTQDTIVKEQETIT